ncbi:MAG: hypothetical protein Q4C34_04710 [Bacteroidales bacterium]|nr:hypothetical protein [Bacteroidales bacterium]
MRRNSIIIGLLQGLAVLSVLVVCGMGMAILQDTFMPAWMPVAFGVVGAAVLLPAMLSRWASFVPSAPKWMLGVMHMIAFAGLFFFAVLASNYYFANTDTAESAKATVVDKHREEHTRYRRLGRNRYVPAGTYHTWHLVLELDDGRRYKQSVSLTAYNRSRVGSVRHLPLQRGLFGFTVVKDIPHSDE